MNPLLLLLTCFAGWMNRHQQVVIEYLQEEKLREDRRKGLLLPPEAAEALYRKGMNDWHRGNKANAMKLICRAARNGDENARMMANMNGWNY